jgi:hypothetical protein
MNTAAATEPRISTVEVTASEIVAILADGRRISVPLSWSWRLAEASPRQRQNFEIIGAGTGVHWPDIDEDISVAGMLNGTPARRRASDHSDLDTC